MRDKALFSGYVTLFIGVALLAFTFVSAYLFLSNDPAITGSYLQDNIVLLALVIRYTLSGMMNEQVLVIEGSILQEAPMRGKPGVIIYTSQVERLILQLVAEQ